MSTGPNNREMWEKGNFTWFILTGPHGMRGAVAQVSWRCRCQMAQSLVCQSEALGSYPEGIWRL